MTSPMRSAKWLVLLAVACGGCVGADGMYTSPERLDKGLIVVLPGIEGPSPFNAHIREGLLNAGWQGAVPIYAWGVPVPIAGPLVNQTNFLGNKLAGENVARYVQDYQSRYPGRPVYLVGHSGGGGVAVFAAESLPAGASVDGLVLLSASISSDYPLARALAHCRKGIVNFHNPADVAVLGAGTAVAGNVDGGHGASAGLEGFNQSARGLFDIESLHYDLPHTALTASGFVASRVAPWIFAPAWPPGRAASADDDRNPLAGSAAIALESR